MSIKLNFRRSSSSSSLSGKPLLAIEDTPPKVGMPKSSLSLPDVLDPGAVPGRRSGSSLQISKLLSSKGHAPDIPFVFDTEPPPPKEFAPLPSESPETNSLTPRAIQQYPKCEPSIVPATSTVAAVIPTRQIAPVASESSVLTSHCGFVNTSIMTTAIQKSPVCSATDISFSDTLVASTIAKPSAPVMSNSKVKASVRKDMDTLEFQGTQQSLVSIASTSDLNTTVYIMPSCPWQSVPGTSNNLVISSCGGVVAALLSPAFASDTQPSNTLVAEMSPRQFATVPSERTVISVSNNYVVCSKIVQATRQSSAVTMSVITSKQTNATVKPLASSSESKKVKAPKSLDELRPRLIPDILSSRSSAETLTSFPISPGTTLPQQIPLNNKAILAMKPAKAVVSATDSAATSLATSCSSPGAQTVRPIAKPAPPTSISKELDNSKPYSRKARLSDENLLQGSSSIDSVPVTSSLQTGLRRISPERCTPISSSDALFAQSPPVQRRSISKEQMQNPSANFLERPPMMLASSALRHDVPVSVSSSEGLSRINSDAASVVPQSTMQQGRSIDKAKTKFHPSCQASGVPWTSPTTPPGLPAPLTPAANMKPNKQSNQSLDQSQSSGKKEKRKKKSNNKEDLQPVSQRENVDIFTEQDSTVLEDSLNLKWFKEGQSQTSTEKENELPIRKDADIDTPLTENSAKRNISQVNDRVKAQESLSMLNSTGGLGSKELENNDKPLTEAKSGVVQKLISVGRYVPAPPSTGKSSSTRRRKEAAANGISTGKNDEDHRLDSLLCDTTPTGSLTPASASAKPRVHFQDTAKQADTSVASQHPARPVSLEEEAILGVTNVRQDLTPLRREKNRPFELRKIPCTTGAESSTLNAQLQTVAPQNAAADYLFQSSDQQRPSTSLDLLDRRRQSDLIKRSSTTDIETSNPMTQSQENDHRGKARKEVNANISKIVADVLRQNPNLIEQASKNPSASGQTSLTIAKQMERQTTCILERALSRTDFIIQQQSDSGQDPEKHSKPGTFRDDSNGGASRLEEEARMRHHSRHNQSDLEKPSTSRTTKEVLVNRHALFEKPKSSSRLAQYDKDFNQASNLSRLTVQQQVPFGGSRDNLRSDTMTSSQAVDTRDPVILASQHSTTNDRTVLRSEALEKSLSATAAKPKMIFPSIGNDSSSTSRIQQWVNAHSPRDRKETSVSRAFSHTSGFRPKDLIMTDFLSERKTYSGYRDNASGQIDERKPPDKTMDRSQVRSGISSDSSSTSKASFDKLAGNMTKIDPRPPDKPTMQNNVSQGEIRLTQRQAYLLSDRYGATNKDPDVKPIQGSSNRTNIHPENRTHGWYEAIPGPSGLSVTKSISNQVKFNMETNTEKYNGNQKNIAIPMKIDYLPIKPKVERYQEFKKPEPKLLSQRSRVSEFDAPRITRKACTGPLDPKKPSKHLNKIPSMAKEEAGEHPHWTQVEARGESRLYKPSLTHLLHVCYN